MYLIIDKANRSIEEGNVNKCLTLVSADKNKDTLKTSTELWDKIKDLIRSMTNTSAGYDEKYMQTKFNSDDNLPLNKILKVHNLIIFVRSVFPEGKKYYPQVFLNECL